MVLKTRLYRLLLAWLLASALPVEAKETLRVLAWPGYADPDVVQAFEQRHNVNVAVTFVSTDDELWARGSANGGQDFDVIAVNTAELQRYIDAGLSVPVQVDKIPNTRQQLPRFRALTAIPGLVHGGKAYAIPYTYSEMGLIYNRKLVDKPPTSMAAMWEPRYRGKVLLYEGSAHNFSLTALLMGINDPFHLNGEQFNQVVRKLVTLRDQVYGFYGTPEEGVKQFRSRPTALMFGNYGTQQVRMLKDAGADIGYVVPSEGALAWLDCWGILRGAKDIALAEAWINYSLSREVSQKLTARQGLANTIEGGNVIREQDKIVWLQPVEDAEKRTLFWGRVLAGFKHEKP